MPSAGSSGFRRVPLGWRLISRDWLRFLITVSGAGVALALMLFLVGVYEGVKTEANGYVSGRPAAAWVAQKGTNNLVRGTSFLSVASGKKILEVPSVASVAPFLRLVTTMTVRGAVYTSFVCGIDPAAPETRPDVVDGTATMAPGDMLVDRAFASRAGLKVGDTLTIQEKTFKVAGLTSGTNAVVTQFTFISNADAQKLLPIGLQNIVSYFLVTAKPGVTPEALVADVRATSPEINIFTNREFTQNNLDELRSGVLPILATVAVFGGIVGAAVLTLLLYSLILERREDYALLKALGVGRGYLRWLVVQQCLVAVISGLIVGILICITTRPLIGRLAPVLVLAVSWQTAGLIAGAALFMGALGSWLPLSRLEKIYPAEVFRA